MNRFRIVADSSCDLLTPDGAYFVSVPLTIRTDTEEFRDDAFLDVNEMVTVLRGTGGRSYSACPNIADWEDRLHHHRQPFRQLQHGVCCKEAL